jgi:hypothetical protein
MSSDLWPWILGAFIGLVCGSIFLVRRQQRKGLPLDTIDYVLAGFSLPLVLLGAVGSAYIAFANDKTIRREGDEDLTSDVPPQPPEESRGALVARVLEDEAQRVEEHVLNEATDNEVAARGAGLFDPGKA